jgi:hypothetical protein
MKARLRGNQGEVRVRVGGRDRVRVMATFRARARARARVKPIRKPSWLRPQPTGAPEASLSARSCSRLPRAPARLGLPADQPLGLA